MYILCSILNTLFPLAKHGSVLLLIMLHLLHQVALCCFFDWRNRIKLNNCLLNRSDRRVVDTVLFLDILVLLRRFKSKFALRIDFFPAETASS